MPLSRDPNARSKQLANLSPNAAATHGLRSAEVATLAESYLAELLLEFPTASQRVLRLQARRLAKVELCARYLNEHGLVRSKRTGAVRQVAEFEETLTKGFLAEQARLEERQRLVNGHGGASLEAIATELTAGES